MSYAFKVLSGRSRSVPTMSNPDLSRPETVNQTLRDSSVPGSCALVAGFLQEGPRAGLLPRAQRSGNMTL